MNKRLLSLPQLSAWHRFQLLGVVLAMAASVGCGDGSSRPVPVSGTVLIDGKPLTTGVVMFVPIEGRTAVGAIDEQGHFELTCKKIGDGALLGTHQVAVDATEPLPGDQIRWYAPKKYADYRTSGLTQEVKGETDDIVIELEWNGGKPFVER